MLLAICSAVVVFPHHLAPSMSTAPFPANLRCSRLSATLFLYIFSISFHHHDCCKDTNNLSNSPIWLKTVHPFGQYLFQHLANICSPTCPENAKDGKHFRRKNVKTALPGVYPPRTAKVKCLHGFLRVLFCTKGKIQCPPRKEMNRGPIKRRNEGW